MRIIKLSLISLLFLIPLNLTSQDSKINENINTNKFRQLYQEFSSPNMFRTASGAPGPAYYQQQADYKINIELIDDTLELINKISPISYTTIHDNYKKYGFIAQEIEEIFPNVVNKPENKDELYSIDYISIIPLLTKSIQELTIIVNNQQKELNYLKTKL